MRFSFYYFENNIESLTDEVFSFKLYSCNINFVYKYVIFEKKQKRISSVPDSNRCTREFSV